MKKIQKQLVLLAVTLILVLGYTLPLQAQNALVFQSDFGLKDGAVASMKGVAFGVSPEIKQFDITHEIPAFDIWSAAYQLKMTAPYWPAGTVFVSVVDPGVGTDRKSVVLKTRTGHFVVSPDNGTLTLIADELGIEEVREIDEAVNRRQNSQHSYTFHGRDVYAYTGARLAAGLIKFEEVGKKLEPEIVRIPYQRPSFEGETLLGTIPIIDVQFGNIWTNINKMEFSRISIVHGDIMEVTILKEDKIIYTGELPLVHTFGDVEKGQPLAYFNSLMHLSFAVNWGNFAEQFNINSGPQWIVKIKKIKKADPK